MPLAFGGTNHKINHQLISAKENLSKSSSIPFDNIMHINPLLLCKRWRYIIYEAQREKISINTFRCRIQHAMLDEQKKLSCMSDEELENVYIDCNKQNNRRFNTKSCVKKFRKYCSEILKFN